MTTVPPTNPGDTRSLRPVGWLAVITLLGWLAFALWPGLLLTLGIHDYGTNYLDSYALLAAVDAVTDRKLD